RVGLSHGAALHEESPLKRTIARRSLCLVLGLALAGLPPAASAQPSAQAHAAAAQTILAATSDGLPTLPNNAGGGDYGDGISPAEGEGGGGQTWQIPASIVGA